MAGRFSGTAGGVPERLARFASGVAGFDGGLTRYARFSRCARFAKFAPCGCPFCEVLELELELLFGGLPCWRPGSMRSIALSWLMMLSGFWDGEGSGTGESLAEMGGSLGPLLGCLLAQSEVNMEWVIVSIE